MAAQAPAPEPIEGRDAASGMARGMAGAGR